MMNHSERYKIRNLNALLEVSIALGAEVELDNLLKVIINKTTEVMNAERSSLFLYDENRNELWSKVAEGMEEKIIRFPLGVGIAGEVAKTRKTEIISDAYQDARFNPDFDKSSHFRTRSILCMPLITNEDKLIGVIEVLNKKSGETFDEQDKAFLEALASHTVVALERARLTEALLETRKIQESLRLAHSIQMGFLPKKFPPFPEKSEFEIFANIKPAKEVGGDLYDFFLIDENHLCFVIGDVSGKGIPAALFMAVTKTLIKAITTSSSTPDTVLYKVNKELCQENESGMFVTLFYGILNLKSGEIFYSNGGHNRPYLIRNNGHVTQLDAPTGIALGVLDDFEYEMCQTYLNKNEIIYLYTDGINEAMDHNGNEFSYSRLENFLKEASKSSATEIIKGSIEAVDLFTSGTPQSDDITAMAIRYCS